MTQLKNVVDPFGEVNVYPTGAGKVRVRATILMEPHKEGTQTGIALDGSGSMSEWYGVSSGGFISPIFGRPKPSNIVAPVAQKICAYLARKIDADNGTTVIYWATGPGGSQIQVIGDLTADQAEKFDFPPPKDFGTGTRLLPAVTYFLDRFADAPFGFYVFITDGELHDMDEVKSYSERIAREIEAGKRRPVKLLLLGVGSGVNEKQLAELDDLDTGSVDLWDFKLAAELRQVEQIFAEVVDRNARVAPKAKVFDASGKLVRDFSDTGLCAVFEFEIDAKSPYFTLELPGYRVHQALSDSAVAPASEKIAGTAIASASTPAAAAAASSTTAGSSQPSTSAASTSTGTSTSTSTTPPASGKPGTAATKFTHDPKELNFDLVLEKDQVNFDLTPSDPKAPPKK